MISAIIICLALIIILMDSVGIMLFIPLILNYFPSISNEKNNIVQQDISIITQLSDKFIDLLNINPIMFVIMIFIVKSLIVTFHGNLIAFMKSEIVREKRSILLERLFRRNEFGLGKRSTGDLTNIITEQGFRSGLVVLFCFQLISQLLATVLYVSLGLYVSYTIGFYIACCSIAFFLIYKPLNKKLKKYSRELTLKSNAYSSRVDEIFSHRDYLKITQRDAKLSDSAGRLATAVANFDRKVYKIIAISSALKEPIIITFLLCVISIEWYLQKSTNPEILISLALIYRGATAGFSAQNFYQKFIEHEPSFQALETFGSSSKEISHKEYGRDNLMTLAKLQIVNGKKTVNGRVLFQNLNIDLRAGETLAIIGKSGTGKSTLVSVLAGVKELDSGFAKLVMENGLEVKDIAKMKLGLVPQEPAIFEGTLLNNITFDFSSDKVIGKSNLSKIYEILSNLGLISELQLDTNLDFHIKENGKNLSGGQKQRIHFARELFLDRQLILLDEPTSALDYESSKFIKKLIMDHKGKKTFVIVTHDMSFASCCDAILQLGAIDG